MNFTPLLHGTKLIGPKLKDSGNYLTIKFSNSNVTTGLLHNHRKWTISEVIREVPKNL